MVYMDTSVLVALIVNEPHSKAVSTWYGKVKGELVSAVWCVPEFASALGIKQRTGQIDKATAEAAWERFERLVANDLRLLQLDAGCFHKAAIMTLDSATSLRAGDALHLACAEQAGVKAMATLDDVLARNAQKRKIKPVEFAA
jgi:predicted nucleic acid-binding protein